MKTTSRWASVELPEALINDIARKLEIRDLARIPKTLIIGGPAEEEAEKLGIPKHGGIAKVLIVP
jgi:hypothetical protein